MKFVNKLQTFQLSKCKECGVSIFVAKCILKTIAQCSNAAIVVVMEGFLKNN